MTHTTTTQRGFTLLLASLIASLLTSLGIAMFTIAQKEVILSSLGRDSQYAFYAADSGAECALYWDFNGAFTPDTVTHDARCNSTVIGEYRPPDSTAPADLVIGGKPYSAGLMTTNFYFEQNGHCVLVQVTKRETGQPSTIINSRGYSTACDTSGEPIATSRTLERAVRMQY